MSSDVNRHRPRRRHVVSAGLRAISAIIAVALLAAVGVTGWKGWLPQWQAAAPATEVTPAAVQHLQACAGALRQGGSATSETAGTAVGTADVAAAAGTVALQTLTGASTGDQTPAGGIVTATASGQTAALVARVGTRGAAASTLQATHGAGDLSGLGLTSCVEPAFDSWITAGSTVTGRNATLILVNPSSLPAEVTPRLYTSSGVFTQQIDPLRVSPHSTRAVPLAAYAPDLPALAVRVTSDRAPVAAFLQQDITRGVQAGGSEIAAPGASPSRQQVITGLTITDPDAQNTLAADADWADAVPVLRLLAPDHQTTARIRITGGGRTITQTQALLPGMVADVPLTALGGGTYRVSVQADADILAAARSVTGGQDQPDFAWLPSAVPVTSALAVSVPAGLPDATLAVSAQGGDSVKVRLVPASGGSARTVQATAGGPATVTLPAGSTWTLQPAGAVAAAVTVRGDGALGQAALYSPGDVGAVTVRLR